MKRTYNLVFLLCLIGTGLFLSSCGSGNSGSPTPTPVPALVSYDTAIYPVERGSILEQKNLVGQVVPLETG